MLIVLATLPGKPESRDELAALLAQVAATSRGDAGCRSYSFLCDVEDPTRFVSIETWDDRASLDAHMKAPHMAEAGPRLMGLLAGAPDIQVHELP